MSDTFIPNKFDGASGITPRGAEVKGIKLLDLIEELKQRASPTSLW